MRFLPYPIPLLSVALFLSRKSLFCPTWIAGMVLLGCTTLSTAATIPAGMQLHPKQEIIRNNGSEPETLDPALVESVGAYQIASDLFEGLTATNTAGET